MQILSSLLAQAAVVDPSDDRGLVMSIFIWLVVGLVAGFLASKIVNKVGSPGTELEFAL